VVINYARNEEAAEEVARLAREFGVRALPLRSDVSEVDQAAAMVAKTVEQFGRIDLLVANAGIWEGAPVEELSEDVWTGSSMPISKGRGHLVARLCLS